MNSKILKASEKLNISPGNIQEANPNHKGHFKRVSGSGTVTLWTYQEELFAHITNLGLFRISTN